eukprot:9317077-Pyramimonas_sp.AAC.1
MTLAPLHALTGLPVLRERSGFPRALPCSVVDLPMPLSRTSLAGNPGGGVAARVPAMAADSATSGICTSAVGVVVVGFGRACGGAA